MHLPVLLSQVLQYLDPAPGDTILDATIGGGGHAAEILKKISPGGRLIAIDRDSEAIERTSQRFKNQKDNEIIFINDNFRNIDRIVEKTGIAGIDGAVFDFGISSFQVDEGRRGFSFLRDGPLDMRFDPGQKLSAFEVINRFGREEITEIIREYGEERHAKLLASAICADRQKKKIGTTGELTDIILKTVGKKYSRQRIHPAARTFQALRIFVNDELSSIEEGISKTISQLRPGSRICVVSFHSLEDRIVKNIFRDTARSGTIGILTKKPLYPDQKEQKENPRSRSAKLRVAEKN